LSLGYTNISNESLYSMGRHCPTLTSLDLSLCVAVSDDGLTALTGAGKLPGPRGGGGRLSRLAYLSLRYTNVTDAALFALAASCPELAQLDLKGCRGVTAAGMAAVREGCRPGVLVSVLPNEGPFLLSALMLGGLFFCGIIVYGLVTLIHFFFFYHDW
jgi:hypothetical protein